LNQKENKSQLLGFFRISNPNSKPVVFFDANVLIYHIKKAIGGFKVR
jgi:hypothetical protein